jgi:hypothetical protein
MVLGFLAAAAIALGSGCAKKTAVPSPPPPDSSEDISQDASPSMTTLPERVAAINIIDDRAVVDPENRILNMPEWTIVGQKDKVYPTLTERHDKLIRDEIRRHFGEGPPDVTIDVFVLEGSQEFAAGERYESITATFGLRLEIASHASIHDVFVGEGEATIDREALDITYDTLHVTYEEAIEQSIRDAIDRVISRRAQSRGR